ncbi:MAG: glycosyltransferase family 2 protein [Bacteroidota bacterium]
MLDLSIVIPALDEADSLPELAAQIRSVCEGAELSFEVWFIDDGSQDATWHVMQQLHDADPRFHAVRFQRNYGKSAAMAVGFERAQGRYVLTMDADLQDDPNEIPALIEHIEKGYDLVVGWKAKRNDPLSKTIPSRFFNGLTRLVSGIKLHDFNSGLKLYRKPVVKSIKLYGELHRYTPLLAKWEGFSRIAEKPVQHHARKYGRSKFGLLRMRGVLDLFTLAFLMRFTARPMQFFGGLGTLAFAGGFVISLWISIEKVFFGKPIGDRPLLLLGVLLIMVGVQMFTTGLLGELIIRPQMERTSIYQITETLEGSAQGSA